MNDPEFLELLNLYVDQELSPKDALRLEAEVQRNPARLATYREYCRMQKACTLLASDFVEQAAAGDTRNISGFIPTHSHWWSSSYAAAGLVTAAACVAFVLISRHPDQARALTAPVALNQPVEASSLEKASLAASAPLHAVTMPSRRGELQSVIAPYSFRRNTPAANDVASDARLNWLEHVQLVSMPRPEPTAESLRFETTTAQKVTPASFGTLNGPTEINALQFQR